MSWLFSQALVAEYLGANCLDGEPSALLSGSPTPQAYLPSDRMTAFSRPSRFGMTFAPLTDTLGAELLTWFRGASLARTSAWPVKAQESPGLEVECGVTWRASLAKFDPVSSSWKTAQLSLLEDSELSSVTWPRSGMTAGGQCWELPTLERPTAANDSGLSGIPTPGAQDGSGGGAAIANLKGQIHLRDWVKTWPTPTVCGNYNRKGASATSGDGLATAVLKVATPTARDWRSGKASQATHDKNSRPLSEQIGGSLNPTWVEWLMGWPLGWTDLKPLGTGKCPDAQPRLSAC
jgi:hypothetical protein